MREGNSRQVEQHVDRARAGGNLICVEGRERSRAADSHGQEVSEREVLRVGQTTQGLRGTARGLDLILGGKGSCWQVAGWGVCLLGWQVQEIITTTVSRTS